MRLPFPEHVPLVPVFYFAAVLCAIQQFQGTNSAFSLCCFFFILLSAIAFNVAGGFTRPSGAFVFFYSTLGVIVGLCVKAYLGEPADSNLYNPLLTIKVFLFGMCMMLVVVFLSRKISTKRALLGKMITDVNMQTATVGSMVTGVVLTTTLIFVPQGSGSVLSALNQLNRFLPLAIVLGVIHTIRRSGGTRSVNLPIVLSIIYMFVVGVLGFSKEGMISPLVCWFLAAASQRYKVSRGQIVVGLLAVVIIFRYLVPYAQYGRVYRSESKTENLQAAIALLSDLGQVREDYLSSSFDAYEERILGYYNTPQGFFDRLQMISIDDALINHTEQVGPLGLLLVAQSFENLVPHFIWKDKPAIFTGNYFAHEIGILGEEDETTGISFSSTAAAYRLEAWTGIFLLAPALWLMLFTILDSLCGDVRKAPWGLLVMLVFSHTAPEGDLSSVVYTSFYTSFGIVFAAVLGAYLMPIIGTFFIGPEGIQLRRGATVQRIVGGQLRGLAQE